MSGMSFKDLFNDTSDRPVCYLGNGELFYLQALLRDACKIRNVLSRHEASRWILVADDTLNFLRGFLGLLLANKAVLLPPNAQPGTLDEFIEQPQGILCDLDFSTTLPRLSISQICATHDIAESTMPTRITDIDSCIELYTSGSTGEPKKIIKSLATIERETACLEHLWGNVLEKSLVISTVSHQHIYGLLFRVMWPLLAGHIFLNKNIAYPEQLEHYARQYDKLVLISSPAYLKRMIEVTVQEQLHGHLTRIFSSGGLLAQEIAHKYYQKFGYAPIEVLGSTETGGVAYRQQTDSNSDTWEKMPDVDVRSRAEDGVLEIRSPFCFTDEWFAMGDRVDIIDTSHFRLLGRLDRIVKLEEKRISLDQMERLLETSDDVTQAKIIAIPGKRTVLGAVCLLNESGRRHLASVGKKEFSNHLREHLLQYFELVTLPRKWRYPADLPYNNQGKVTQQALLDLFSHG